jgi:hypothetical protein
LEKLSKRKKKKTRLSFKQGTADHKILDQVTKCWFAKEGEFWPGQIVGTREYLRHIEIKTRHGLIKKPARCQIWSSFCSPWFPAACRLRESDSSSLCIPAIMQS